MPPLDLSFFLISISHFILIFVFLTLDAAHGALWQLGLERDLKTCAGPEIYIRAVSSHAWNMNENKGSRDSNALTIKPPIRGRWRIQKNDARG